MGIVKISDELHEEIRKASSVLSRSINSQAEFWVKMGMLAELHPELSFNQIKANLMQSVNVSAENLTSTESQASTENQASSKGHNDD
ncbi:ParD-like family protein [Vibrio amylolyticus]|uniref:ParD-like family protein n=1 Tax=Vibrio amylolyticus TaxID=2847292 RepID=UPI00354E416D